MRGLLVAGVLLAVSVLGMLLPRFIIGDGVNRYETIENKIARDQLLQSEAFFAGEPYSQLAITAMRVTSVHRCPRNGEVQMYAFFGVPIGELRFQCTGTEIIRCPRNSAEFNQGSMSTTARRMMAESDNRRGGTAKLSQYVETQISSREARAKGVPSG